MYIIFLLLLLNIVAVITSTHSQRFEQKQEKKTIKMFHFKSVISNSREHHSISQRQDTVMTF